MTRCEPERQFVIEREGDVRVLHDQVAIENGGIAQMLEDRRVDLRVLLQPGVARELKEGQQRESADRGTHRKGAALPQTSLSGSFLQLFLEPDALGIEVDGVSATPAAPQRCGGVCAERGPARDRSRADLGSSSMAFWKSFMASSGPPPNCCGR